MISILVIGKNGYESNLDLCTAARAFGASNVTFSSKKNSKLIRHFGTMNKKWGGTFSVSFTNDWKKFIDDHRNYKVVYLTRYGVPINKVSYSIKTYKNILVVVSISDAMKQVMQISDFNVGITTQPHCAASAIAVFLHHFYEGRELAMHFENAQLKVVPDERSVHVEKVEYKGGSKAK
ncbi:MAG: hypothetical protein M1504_00700 [Candidatus Marsarchaeota archaeon]|nr:hypothetical protein [Candidatus Marsarchaeota archaeon]